MGTQAHANRKPRVRRATELTKLNELQAADRIGSRPAGLWAIAAGGLIAFSMPPWAWWPLAFVGIAIWDRLLENQDRRMRFRCGFLVGVSWMFPATLWMWDLTPPGYIIQGLLYASFYGVASMVVPPSGRWRSIVLPAMLVLVAALRWNWPFGGVPLATLALSQSDAPLAQTARLFGSLTIVALVGVCGVVLSALARGNIKAAGVGIAVVAGALVLAAVAPNGSAVETRDIAIVQGGGPQNTRALNTNARDVFDRHVAATDLVQGPVDLVLWPENVVFSRGPMVEAREFDEMAALAAELDAPLVAGIIESFSAEGFFNNASITIMPDGTLLSRYDKLRRVPFGEYVPLRSLIEALPAASEFLPSNDARAGTGPAIIDTGAGLAAIAISWEIFHDDRIYSGVNAGGEILLNPTNGSSFWLTMVQTQQVASSQLRAIETGRWVLQAAPTGFSAIIEPDGTVIDRSAISETKVIQGTVELRTGRTLATIVGPWPAIIAAALTVGLAWRGNAHPRHTPEPN